MCCAEALWLHGAQPGAAAAVPAAGETGEPVFVCEFVEMCCSTTRVCMLCCVKWLQAAQPGPAAALPAASEAG
jgi:hypothetical protein